MKYIKFLIIFMSICFLLSCRQSTENIAESDDIKYSDVFDMSEDNIRSILGVSLESRWEFIGNLFLVEPEVIRNNILSKDIFIENYKAKLIVFISDSSIYQITLFIEQQNNSAKLDVFLQEIMKEIDKYINIGPYIDIIEDNDGSVLEEITTFDLEHKRFFISSSDKQLSFNLASNNQY